LIVASGVTEGGDLCRSSTPRATRQRRTSEALASQTNSCRHRLTGQLVLTLEGDRRQNPQRRWIGIANSSSGFEPSLRHLKKYLALTIAPCRTCPLHAHNGRHLIDNTIESLRMPIAIAGNSVAYVRYSSGDTTSSPKTMSRSRNSRDGTWFPRLLRDHFGHAER
jgi:hypothetical protein